MKTIVIYNSQTGFTKKYAQWIAEKTNGECVEFSKAKKLDLSGFDAIVFGGWAVAGSISKLKWFKKNISKWSGKKLAVFCCGARRCKWAGRDEELTYSAEYEVRPEDYYVRIRLEDNYGRCTYTSAYFTDELLGE